jgi:hypothetical protein
MPSRLKLGKLSPKANPKTLLFSKYLKATAPPPPPSKVFREYKIPSDAWGMFANDTVGDCTCADVAHEIMLFTAHTGNLVTPEISDVLAMYSAITGYDPKQTDALGNNPTDTGAAITDVLNYWQTTGLAGHKILGWAQIDHTNLLHRKQGIYIFGANDVGVQLPTIAQDQFGADETWDVVSDDGGIEGGHCITEIGYGTLGSDFVTWGKGDQKATTAWSNKYVDEAYVVITQDWLNEASGLAPNSLDLDALNADLQALRA